MKNIRFNLLLWLWSLAALCAAAAHIVLPMWTAAGTTWVPSVHWQREIACFDVALACVFIWAARQQDLTIKRNLTLLLCALSLALGENHLEGWLQDAKLFHVIFTVANFLAVLWGGVACWHYHATNPGSAEEASHQKTVIPE